MNIKNYMILILTITFALTSCKDDDDPAIEYVTVTETVEKEVTVTNTVEVDPYADSTLEGNITSNTTLDASKVWLLKGRVSVVDGVTLTIPAGTVIKAQAGTGTDASTLIIARGGKIDAQGTSDSPIVMTSVSDNIQAGGTYPSSGPALGIDARGLWGGLLILGKAPSSFSGDVTELQIEGIPSSDINGLYGGNDAADNSGTLKYVSIRHGGAEIGEGNEINGLTLGGVGNGTVIDNIEVIANVDDGIEFFGGTVNASNLLVWGQGDDGLDIDQAYAGTITNGMVVLEAASDHGLEIDGPEGSAAGSFTLKNITLVGATKGCAARGVNGEMADFRKGATGSLNAVYIKDFVGGKDIELDAQADSDSYAEGKLTFTNIDIQHPVDSDGNTCSGTETINQIFDDKVDSSKFESDATSFAEIVTSKKEGNGADESAFSWTFYKR